jgi:hypothetical protein
MLLILGRAGRMSPEFVPEKLNKQNKSKGYIRKIRWLFTLKQEIKKTEILLFNIKERENENRTYYLCFYENIKGFG